MEKTLGTDGGREDCSPGRNQRECGGFAGAHELKVPYTGKLFVSNVLTEIPGGWKHEKGIAYNSAAECGSGTRPFCLGSTESARRARGPEQARRDCTQCHEQVSGCQQSRCGWIQSCPRLRQRLRPWSHGNPLRQYQSAERTD